MELTDVSSNDNAMVGVVSDEEAESVRGPSMERSDMALSPVTTATEVGVALVVVEGTLIAGEFCMRLESSSRSSRFVWAVGGGGA